MTGSFDLKKIWEDFINSEFCKKVKEIYDFLASQKWVRFILFMYLAAFTMFAYTLVRNSFTIPIGGDFTLQQIPFYFNGYDDWWHALTTGEFVMWDDSGFLGVNNIGANSFYYLFNPFFLVLLIVPRSILPQAQAFMMITKIVLAGVSMKLLLEKFKLKEETTVLFAIAYAFCGWNLYYLWFNHFLEIAVLMPLVLLGIENIIQDRNPLLLTIMIFISGLTNYFFLICFCFCGVIYAGFRFFQNWQNYTELMKENDDGTIKLDVRIIVILQGIFAFATGLMLSCLILLPCFHVAISTPRAESTYFKDLLEIFENFGEAGFFETISDTWNYLFTWPTQNGEKYILYPLISFFTPNVNCFDSVIFNNEYYDNTYCSMFLYTPILLFFIPSLISAIKRKRYSVIVGLLGMGFLLFTPFAYYCFSGFTSVAYARWYIFVACAAVIFLAIEYEHKEEMSAWYLDISVAVILCIYGYLLYKGELLVGSENVDNIKEMDQSVIYLYVQIVYLIIQYIYLRKNFKKPELTSDLKYFVVFEAIVMCNITLLCQGTVNYQNLYQGIDNIHHEMDICNTLMNEDDDYFRVFSTTCDRDGNNSAMMMGTPGIGTFHSIYNFEAQEFINWSTVSYNGSWSMGVHEKRINLDQFLGVKYYILKQTDINVPFGYSEYLTTDTHIVYVNDNFIELGYAFDDVYSSSLMSASSWDTAVNENVYLQGAILSSEDIEELNLKNNNNFDVHTDYYDKYDGIETINPDNQFVKLYKAKWELNPSTGYEEFKGYEDPISYNQSETKGVRWNTYLDIDLKSYNVANNASDSNNAFVTVIGRMGENLCITLFSEDASGNEYILTRDTHMVHWYAGKQYDRKYHRGFYVDNRVTRIEIMVNDNLSEEQHLIKPQVTVQYENTFNERIEKLRKDPLYDIKKTANTATYKTNFDSQKMVVLQIPYDSGWSLTATRVEDNQITSPKVYKSHGGFISYLAEPGEYEYHLSYTTPYLKEGILIMAIGMLCVGCYVIGAYIYDTDKKKYLARTLD